MFIGQISELSGYSQRMIRYLEDQKLVAPQRSDSNQRKFSDQNLTRILKIKRFKELGFTYPEIKMLIDQGENALVDKGSELLKRHHAEAQELLDKIQQLETLCYGEAKTKALPEKATSFSHPQRTACRIKKLNAVIQYLETHFPDHKSEVVLWKFSEWRNMQTLSAAKNIEIVEIFRGSSQIAILEGSCCLPEYEKAWAHHALPFHPNPVGTFPAAELGEFFGNYEIVIEHKIFAPKGDLLFHTVLPYQALFIASGEAFI